MKLEYNNIVEIQEWRGKDEGKKAWVRHDDGKIAYHIQIDTSWQMGIETNRNVQWLLINKDKCITHQMIMDDESDKLSFRQNYFVMELLNDETEDGEYQQSRPNIINFVNELILFQFGLMIEPNWKEGAKIARDWENEKYNIKRNS